MQEYGLYQYYITTSTTTVRQDDIELDDTAPLPLFIGIGLALFIGFVILVLICCCCRRRRPPATAATDRPANSSHYQRAPVNDGMGAGVAYPMASVPPMSYPNSTVVYPPTHMGHTIQHNYGVIGSGVNYSNANHSHYPQQPPHFGGVPTYPPNHYVSTLPLAPHSTPLQSHSPSHSSQASSSVSGATTDPLVPPSSPYVQQQLSQHHHLPNPQQLQQFQLQQHVLPASALQHHQHMQQQFLSGRQSPAIHFPQMAYAPLMVNEHSSMPRTDAIATTTIATLSQTATLPLNHQPQATVQSSNNTEEDEE